MNKRKETVKKHHSLVCFIIAIFIKVSCSTITYMQDDKKLDEKSEIDILSLDYGDVLFGGIDTELIEHYISSDYLEQLEQKKELPNNSLQKAFDEAIEKLDESQRFTEKTIKALNLFFHKQGYSLHDIKEDLSNNTSDESLVVETFLIKESTICESLDIHRLKIAKKRLHKILLICFEEDKKINVKKINLDAIIQFVQKNIAALKKKLELEQSKENRFSLKAKLVLEEEFLSVLKKSKENNSFFEVNNFLKGSYDRRKKKKILTSDLSKDIPTREELEELWAKIEKDCEAKKS